jgi:hypothetical protein
MATLARYLVEVRRPPAGSRELQAVAAAARDAADRLREEGMPVRFLRSLFVPEDESCFFLYEGPSAEAVGEAGRRARSRSDAFPRPSASILTCPISADRRTSALRLRDHEHDGHDGERDAADGEHPTVRNRSGAWPPVRSACSNSR